MKKKVIRLAVVLLLLCAAAVAAWFGFYREGHRPVNNLVLYGNVDIRQVELAFNASERIARVLVEEGEAVEKGQLLASLETNRLQLAVDRATAQVAAQRDELAKLEAGTRIQEIRRARAEVEAARTQAEDARRTYQRLLPLAQKNLASQEQADEAGARADAAAARLQAAQENLKLALAGPRKEDIDAARSKLKVFEAERDLALQNLADTDLRAPSVGIIQNRILETGDMAFPQRTVFTLALTDPIWIRTYVPEIELGKLFAGMKASVTTDSYPDKTYAAWIGYISPVAEFTPKAVETPELRTRLVYQVRVYVCNPRNELRLGMPATVVIPLGQSPPSDQTAAVPPCKEN